MDPRLPISVIADDLTGAADTGVQFCPVVGPVHLTGTGGKELTLTDSGAGGLAVYTNSRHLAPGVAAERVRRVTARVLRLAPALIYKKIDSCLRGNLGAEIDSLLLETSATASFIAPALPELGRTTVNDVHMVGGIPVAETEIGRDPLCPVSESRLSRLLSGQSRMKVGHVNRHCLDNGSDATLQRVQSLLAEGCRHLAFDAFCSDHLDAIVALERTHFNNEIVLAGSAGLAGSLARFMQREVAAVTAPKRPRVVRWLFCCGSASQVMAEQVANLVDHTHWPHQELDPLQLAADSCQSAHPSREVLVKGLPEDTGVIVSIIPSAGSVKPGPAPEHVVAGLAGTVASLLTATSWQGLFLSGGDSAEAVLAATGASGICLYEEILPGLVRGEIIGGSCHALPVITKAGTFGTADTLIKLINILK
jgi:uncharacterized protein YgbK (DUF1537 family)